MDDATTMMSTLDPVSEEMMLDVMEPDAMLDDELTNDIKLDTDESQEFGYYLDLKRGQMDTENKITMMKILDNVLEKVWAKIIGNKDGPIRKGAVHKS